MIRVLGKYDEVFQIEMEGWAYGISNYPGEIFPELVFRVMRELEGSFVAAVEHHFAFNIIETATMFSRAAKYLVHEKDITFCILSLLPPPNQFDEEGQFVLAQIVDQVEQAYGGALERLEKKWRWEQKSERDKDEAKEAA